MRLAIASIGALHDGVAHEISASFGLAESSDPHGSDEILLAADQALYRAKQGGRNRVELADLTHLEIAGPD